MGLLYEDTEPYRILGGLISELDVAYDENKSLNVAVEEGDEESGETDAEQKPNELYAIAGQHPDRDPAHDLSNSRPICALYMRR